MVGSTCRGGICRVKSTIASEVRNGIISGRTHASTPANASGGGPGGSLVLNTCPFTGNVVVCGNASDKMGSCWTETGLECERLNSPRFVLEHRHLGSRFAQLGGDLLVREDSHSTQVQDPFPAWPSR